MVCHYEFRILRNRCLVLYIRLKLALIIPSTPPYRGVFFISLIYTNIMFFSYLLLSLITFIFTNRYLAKSDFYLSNLFYNSINYRILALYINKIIGINPYDYLETSADNFFIFNASSSLNSGSSAFSKI
jgi:hypothetical protein